VETAIATISPTDQLAQQQLILNAIKDRKNAYVTLDELMILEPIRFRTKRQVYHFIEKNTHLKKQIDGLGKCVCYNKYKLL
jgi:hypothetical protein